MRHGDRLIDYSTDWVADGVFPTISRLNFSCGANIQGILPISIARGNLRLRRCRWIAPGCRSGGNLTAGDSLIASMICFGPGSHFASSQTADMHCLPNQTTVKRYRLAALLILLKWLLITGSLPLFGYALLVDRRDFRRCFHCPYCAKDVAVRTRQHRDLSAPEWAPDQGSPRRPDFIPKGTHCENHLSWLGTCFFDYSPHDQANTP